MTCPTSAEPSPGDSRGPVHPPTKHLIRMGAVGTADEVPDGTAALVVTSPPYPMIALWDRTFAHQDPAIRHALKRADGETAFELMHRTLDPVWETAHRILMPGGILCVNVGDATRSIGGEFRLFSNHSRILHRCLALGFRNLPNILWRKPTNAPTKFMGSGMLPPGAYVTLEHEHILVFRKGGPREFRTAAARARRRESAYFWEERNRWFSDLWEIKGTGQELGIRGGGRVRSAAYPLEIPFRLVLMFSCAGDLVVDPFLGTGTTMLAAAACGRESLGYEMDRRLAAAAGKRLAGACDVLNDRIRARLENHREFVHSKGPGELRYRNTHLRLPVMTRQETDLQITRVAGIHQVAPLQYTVHYSPA